MPNFEQFCLKKNKNRSSDSAKYTNKSSGTSVLSGNINASTFHSKYYGSNGNRHHHRDAERQSHGNGMTTAPVHKKFVANKSNCDSNNHFINRFINNNTQSYNNHYSLSLNRHMDEANRSKVTLGVGCNGTGISTLTSPYAYTGSGVERKRGTKSDIGPYCVSRGVKNSTNFIMHKTNILPSVHSDLSIYETALASHPNIPDKDIFNNNNINNSNFYNGNSNKNINSISCNNVKNDTPMSSASAIMSLSKTGSKLLYTNKHRLESIINNNNNIGCGVSSSQQGPLIYKNDDELMRCDWNNSVFDNPIMVSLPSHYV
jgi:hypothetical protein